jgi:hypothetical protein
LIELIPFPLQNEYMAADFQITVESYHLPGRGDLENVHQLSPEKLALREVVVIDIAADLVNAEDYDQKEDPRRFKSNKTGRGPLNPGWIKTVRIVLKLFLDNGKCMNFNWICSLNVSLLQAEPVMTCYKLVTCHFNWFGLQGRIERMIHRQQLRLFTKFHRQVFCWLDRWHGLTLEDIRNLEKAVQGELENVRKYSLLIQLLA